VTEQVPEVRVGDRERREVDARLQESLADGVLTLTEYDERAAACWSARTRSDLEVLVRDLPGARRPAPDGPSSREPRRVVAVMSESELAVPVVPGQQVQATAVMGTATVDLRRADLPDEVHVRATAVMGEVKVHVPPGTTVHLTGGAVMGERKTRTGPPSATGAVVHVAAVAVMGTVTVDDRERKGGLVPAGRTGSPPARRSGGRRLLGPLLTAALVAGGAVFVGSAVTADDGASVFGSRVVQVSSGDDRVEVGVLFGSVEVVVPDDVRVRTTGTVVFGSVECDDACSVDGGRGLVVDADAGFGSVEVVRRSEARED